MKMYLTIGLGGFLEVAAGGHKPPLVPILIRFGATTITTFLDGEERRRQEMTKPQNEHTIQDITDLVIEAKKLAGNPV